MKGDFNSLWYGVLHHGSRFSGLIFCLKNVFACDVQVEHKVEAFDAAAANDDPPTDQCPAAPSGTSRGHEETHNSNKGQQDQA